jgi:cytochrome c-type biogenesis protein CcmF
MLSELGNFFLYMALGFAGVQILASFWGVIKNNNKFQILGRSSAFLQGGFLSATFLTLILAFFVCDFSILTVALHDHTQLPWYYRMAATWGNHEGSLLLFVLILSGMGVALAALLPNSSMRAPTLTIQGLLTLLFLLFLLITSNPFVALPFSLPEGKSLNPLLQDQGLLVHPPLLYLGYVGFSAPFSLAMAALWKGEEAETWAALVRPWVLFAWSTLTIGITLGSWWAYYELGWGGWWFWDPVENASLMPWLAATALLHTLRSGGLYRWSLFLSLLTFGLSLLGTFLVRSGLITSVHSFAQDPTRGLFILSLLGGIMGMGLFMWTWKAPRLQSPQLELFSRQGLLLLNSLLLCVGLATVLLGTLYPLISDGLWGEKVAVGAPYFERTFIPLMIPLFLLIPFGALLRDKDESLFPLLLTPLTAALGGAVFVFYLFNSPSLWAVIGIVTALWVFVGTVIAFLKKRLSLGPTLAHIGVAITLLGVSVAGGFRMDETRILGLQEHLEVGGTKLTLRDVQYGKGSTYTYERATLNYSGGILTPEKRLYQPQDSLLSETAIQSNGLRDLYVILGPYEGENRWLIRASIIPLAPWIWIGGIFMALGATFSLMKRKHLVFLFFLFSFPAFAEGDLESRAQALYKEVRCSVCVGQSIADSQAPESKALRGFIMQQLREGKSEEAIRDDLRTLFGEDVLFHPPFNNKTLFLWMFPFGLFFAVLLGFLWRRNQGRWK